MQFMLDTFGDKLEHHFGIILDRLYALESVQFQGFIAPQSCSQDRIRSLSDWGLILVSSVSTQVELPF